MSICQPRAIAKAVMSASVARVPVVLGSVKVTSAVEAGPIRVALLVPLSESSKNSKKPALVDPFLSCSPALTTGVVMVGVVRVLLVRVSVVARPTSVSVLVGSVIVPVLLIVLITGAVRVLLVRV